MENKLYHGDCCEILKEIGDASIDVIVTDPPYFIDRMDNSWNDKEVSSKKNMRVVTSLPAGMRFTKEQGRRLYEWYVVVSKELLRVLKPGGFFFSFSSPRLYHNMASAVEDAGFLIKDQFIWLYVKNQAKAMALNHVIDRLKISEIEKQTLKEQLRGWKTPQVKSCHEPIAVAQKPLVGSFLENYVNYGVGLIDTKQTIGDEMFPSNVVSTDEFDEIIDRYFLVQKPTKKEKGDYNFHKTTKPLDLCKYLIALSTKEGQIVLDPFVGSGTTCVAAKQLNRYYVGMDINLEYISIAEKRLANE